MNNQEGAEWLDAATADVLDAPITDLPEIIIEDDSDVRSSKKRSAPDVVDSQPPAKRAKGGAAKAPMDPVKEGADVVPYVVDKKGELPLSEFKQKLRSYAQVRPVC